MGSKHRSKFSTQPILLREGRFRHAVITPRGLEVLKLLSRYRYLPSNYIAPLVGGSPAGLSRYLKSLSADPRRILNKPEHQKNAYNAMYRHLVYELGPGGVDALLAHGIPAELPKVSKQYAHDLPANEIAASFELPTPGIEYISWQEIQKSPKFTAPQEDGSRYIPVRFMWEGEKITSIAADARPFGLAKGDRYFFCPGIEFDTGSEPVNASDAKRSSIEKKLRSYLHILDHEIYREHFGFPNNSFCIPFVTTMTDRLPTMKACLHRLTRGRGSPYILFTTYPAFLSFEKSPPPSNHMLTRTYERVGFPDFRFIGL
jgi:hypothetical protein